LRSRKTSLFTCSRCPGSRLTPDAFRRAGGGIITYLSLIIGELVPKTIALNNAQAIATFLSPAMKLFATVTYPSCGC
jgi:CBS domain containing-hemolysin-like protein